MRLHRMLLAVFLVSIEFRRRTARFTRAGWMHWVKLRGVHMKQMVEFLSRHGYAQRAALLIHRRSWRKAP